MKNYKKILTLASGSLLLAATTHANPIVGDVYSVLLTAVNSTTLVSTPAADFTVHSEATSVGGGEYKYTYSFTTPVNIGEFSVNFPTANANVSDVIGGAITIPHVGTFPDNEVTATDVTWTFNPEQHGFECVSFESPLPPVWGTAGALDGDTWGPNGGSHVGTCGLVVPGAVPDGGTTVALLGGALLGLQGLRRKMRS